jgi:FlaA1/EpsC-like NDP-sugar epimerase
MTIPEASRLVLQAASSGKSGEIFIFDMGKPVRILDMAIRLIRLSGLEPYKDIDIVVTGKRPGEKLYEELFNENCETVETDHEKIFKVKESPGDKYQIGRTLEQIIVALRENNMGRVMSLSSELVPEFKHAKIESTATKISVDH